jgi:O-antigen/teichoic acid export membrane protein
MANGAYAASQWLLVVICAHYFGKNELGTYALILAALSPLFLLGGLNLRGLVSSLPERYYDPQRLLRLQNVGIALATVASISVCVFGLHIGGEGGWFLIAVVTGVKIVETLAEGRYGFLQRNHLMKAIALRKLSRSVLTVLAFFVISNWTRNEFSASMIGVLIASLIVFIFIERKDMRGISSSHRDALPPVRPLVRFALYSGAAAAIDTLIVSIPRLSLGASTNLAAVGTFMVLVQIPMIGSIAVSGVGQSVMSSMRIASTRRNFAKLLAGSHVFVMAIGMVGIALAWLFGNRLMGLIYGAGFADTGSLLISVMWGGLLWYMAGINGVALQARGFYGKQLVTTSSAAITAALVMFVGVGSIHTAIMAFVAAMGARLVVSSLSVLRVMANYAQPI